MLRCGGVVEAPAEHVCTPTVRGKGEDVGQCWGQASPQPPLHTPLPSRSQDKTGCTNYTNESETL